MLKYLPENKPHCFRLQRLPYYAASLENRTELEAAKRTVAQLLKEQVHSEDLIVLKASHGFGMDTLLAIMRKQPNRCP